MSELDADNDDNKEYEVEAIWDSAVYASKWESGYLPGLYYLVAWKDYPKEENTWEPLSTVQYLKKLISCFYKEYLKKPIATFPPINSALLIARPTVKPTKSTTKQKRGQPAKNANKQAKILILNTWKSLSWPVTIAN